MESYPDEWVRSRRSGLGDFQDLINKLPWRKDDRESREARQGRRVDRLDLALSEQAAQIAAQEQQQRQRMTLAAGVGLLLVGAAYLWSKRR